LTRFTIPSLIGLLASLGRQSAHLTSALQREATNQVAGRPDPGNDFEGMKTIADIAKLSFVNKRCRLWAAGGNIDIDQTCLVGKTVNGGLVVIPNEYADKETQEITGQSRSQTKDRCLQRFYEIPAVKFGSTKDSHLFARRG
jgi:hypothetical protein